MKNLILSIASCFILGDTFSQSLVSCTYLNQTSSLILSVTSGLNVSYDVDLYKMVYNTVDVQGNPTIASGAFVVPTNTNCADFPIAAYNHGTALPKNDVPSSDNQETFVGKIFAAGGYFVCMPDYLGMGESPGLHPYVHGESEATATVDMIRAAREFIMDSLNMIDNGQVFLTGYSQGGHACMATHKYIHENNLQNEFDVIASAPCSGPYDLSGIMADTIMSPTPYSNPGYITYLLASYEMVYGNIFTTWSDILYSPYDTLVPPYFSNNNTTLGMGSLNNILPNDMSLLLRDTCMNNFRNDSVNQNHPWWQALLDNDNFNWVPQEPVRMYYCTADEQVAFTNALSAEAYMNANGATSVQAISAGSGNHGACVFPALSAAFNWFQSLKSACTITSSSSLAVIAPQLYPNPSSDFFNVELEGSALLQVFDINGKLVHHNDFDNSAKVDVSTWSLGMYHVFIRSNEHCFRSYFVKN